MNDLDHDPEETPAPPIAPQDRAHAPHTFQGRDLEPFSIRRQIAAQSLGNKLLSGRVRLEEGGAYDGMFCDVAVLIWLCSQPIASSLRALRKPDDALAAALEWAEKTGISIGSEAFTAACAIYGEILGELSDAQFRVVEAAGGPDSKNAGAGLPTAG